MLFVFVMSFVRIPTFDVKRTAQVVLSTLGANQNLTSRESEVKGDAGSYRSSIDGHNFLTSYPDPIDPDKWQTVVPGRIFVYSAHLDPWTFDQTVIRIMGNINWAKMEIENETKLSCKLWLSKNSKDRADVFISPVARISQL